MNHTFHIPVLGLAFSIDSPLKVARYGISSVVSIVDDELIEDMRQFYTQKYHMAYSRIDADDYDARARRITAYLDMSHTIVNEQIKQIRGSDLKTDPEVRKYFRLLPDDSAGKSLYRRLLAVNDIESAHQLCDQLAHYIQPGNIDVNIMSKVDKMNKDAPDGALAANFSDASAALRGFANSTLHASLILSAGMNPRLYQYLSELPQFLPDHEGKLVKRIVLKVSDFRSALIQAKYLTKRGVWISEFRVESGLNCGGHAFATDGYLLGPILEEFKEKRRFLEQELFPLYQQALQDKGIFLDAPLPIRLTAQGGIGTADEHRFLLDYYQLDGTGWGSPFLLVPEATTVDEETLQALTRANEDDFYVSAASPLGVPFNNFKQSTGERLRLERIANGRPGAPCTKKYLVSDTEFGDEPICTASRAYQSKKLRQLSLLDLHTEAYRVAYERIVEKSCLCEGLANAAYLHHDIDRRIKDKAVAICPGPNMAYFKHIYSLEEMVGHIYGKINLLHRIERPSMFINELHLYIQHIERYIDVQVEELDAKKKKYIAGFISQINQGVEYYRKLVDNLPSFPSMDKAHVLASLFAAEQQLKTIAAQD